MGLQPWQTGGGEADSWWSPASSPGSAVQLFAGVDRTPVWDGELSLWPDETRPLSTYLWISRSRDPLSTTCLLAASRPRSPLKNNQQVNIFYGSMHTLALVCGLLALNSPHPPFLLKTPREMRNDTQRQARRCSERDGGATVCWAWAGPSLWDRDGSHSELRHRLRLRSEPFSDDIISRDESVFVFANARRRVVGGGGGNRATWRSDLCRLQSIKCSHRTAS